MAVTLEPFLGEIRIFAGNFAPTGWALCQGQLLAISQNDALFSLLGTTYGGDGQQTFALPDLRGRIPVHQGQGFVIGEITGAETISLSQQQVPPHTHPQMASSVSASQTVPIGNVTADSTLNGANIYATSASKTALADIVGSVGNASTVGQAHENRMPFLSLNFIIALEGIYPTQN